MRTLLLFLLALPTMAQAEYTCPDFAGHPEQLVDLEEYASRGALSDDEKACLEENYAKAAEQTVKNKISRVLMVNGYAYSTEEWARLVERHLDEVDRSDPDIAFLYAYHVFNSDNANAEEAIAWVDVAMERKDAWKGDVFVSRVYGLHRLRSFAAYKIWRDAEEARASAPDTDEAEVERLRNVAKTYAREWVDMAKGAGRNPQDAFDLCITVASAQACGSSGK